MHLGRPAAANAETEEAEEARRDPSGVGCRCALRGGCWSSAPLGIVLVSRVHGAATSNEQPKCSIEPRFSQRASNNTTWLCAHCSVGGFSAIESTQGEALLFCQGKAALALLAVSLTPLPRRPGGHWVLPQSPTKNAVFGSNTRGTKTFFGFVFYGFFAHAVFGYPHVPRTIDQLPRPDATPTTAPVLQHQQYQQHQHQEISSTS